MTALALGDAGDVDNGDGDDDNWDTRHSVASPPVINAMQVCLSLLFSFLISSSSFKNIAQLEAPKRLNKDEELFSPDMVRTDRIRVAG